MEFPGHRELPGKSESSNLSRNKVSREILRSFRCCVCASCLRVSVWLLFTLASHDYCQWCWFRRLWPALFCCASRCFYPPLSWRCESLCSEHICMSIRLHYSALHCKPVRRVQSCSIELQHIGIRYGQCPKVRSGQALKVMSRLNQTNAQGCKPLTFNMCCLNAWGLTVRPFVIEGSC